MGGNFSERNKSESIRILFPWVYQIVDSVSKLSYVTSTWRAPEEVLIQCKNIQYMLGQSIKKNVLQNIKILSNTFNQNVYISITSWMNQRNFKITFRIAYVSYIDSTVL